MSIAKDLYWSGIAELPWQFPFCREVEDHLKTLPIHDGHVPLRGDGTVGTWDEMKGHPVVCPPLVGGTITAPYFLNFCLGFTDLAEEYLGGFPYLYSVHSFWTRPSTTPLNDDIQCWHVDRDAEKFVVLFIYGSDVLTYQDGPHLYECRSHRYKEPIGSDIKRIFGKKGSCFLADTRGRHMGVRPQHDTRLLHWARWCIGTEPVSYGWDKMSPIPCSQVPINRPPERLRESTKLLVNWG